MYPAIKRVLDLLASLLLLVVLFPIIALIAGIVLVVEGRPVFFQQVRPGLNAKPFVLIKFRTMVATRPFGNRDNPETVTRLGSLLRKTSVDELPSLWNVVRGEMSFVGPRPLLEEYLGLYSQRHSRRHEVRPGLTGLAQIAGRNLVAWPDRLDLDVSYVDNRSFPLDFKILVSTIRVVFRSRGINQADGSIMTRLVAGYDSSEEKTT